MGGLQLLEPVLLEPDYAQSGVLERIPYTGTKTSTKEDLAKKWFFNTQFVHERPVRDREHVRFLIDSLNARHWFVTFHTLDTDPLYFVQAGWLDTDTVNVEVNIPEGGWCQRVLRDGHDGVNDITSDSFGDLEQIWHNEVFTFAEAFMLCSAWMNKQMVPDGFIFGPVEGYTIKKT